MRDCQEVIEVDPKFVICKPLETLTTVKASVSIEYCKRCTKHSEAKPIARQHIQKVLERSSLSRLGEKRIEELVTRLKQNQGTEEAKQGLLMIASRGQVDSALRIAEKLEIE